jgi:hypothetical protein
MPVLRALALLGFLLGTAVLAIGIVRDQWTVAVAGGLLWAIGVAVGLFAKRFELAKAR